MQCGTGLVGVPHVCEYGGSIQGITQHTQVYIIWSSTWGRYRLVAQLSTGLLGQTEHSAPSSGHGGEQGQGLSGRVADFCVLASTNTVLYSPYVAKQHTLKASPVPRSFFQKAMSPLAILGGMPGVPSLAGELDEIVGVPVLVAIVPDGCNHDQMGTLHV